MTALRVPPWFPPSPAGGRPGWGRRVLAVALNSFLTLFIFLSLALPGAGAHAQDVLPVPALTARVIDQTGTLTPAQVQALSSQLEVIETTRGAQVVVLIVPTSQPEDIAAYGQRVADTWKVGRRDVGDGIVIVVAKNDRRINIEVAKTLEGAIPDVIAGRIINDQIKPAFKAGDYAGGLNAAVDRLSQRIAGEGLAEPAAKNGGAKHGSKGFDLQDLALFLFVGVPILGAVLTGIFGRKFGALLTGGAIGGIGWWLTTSLLVASGAGLVALFLVGVMGMGMGMGSGRLGGMGRAGPIIWGGGGGGGFGGRSGGGGFGSGGGGNFGGGGASGTW